MKYRIITVFVIVILVFPYSSGYSEFKIRSHRLYDEIEIGCHPKNIITEVYYPNIIFSYIDFSYGRKGDIFCWRWYDPKGNMFRESTFVLNMDIRRGCAYDPDFIESKCLKEFQSDLLNCLNKDRDGWKVEVYFNNELQFVESFYVIFPKYNVEIQSNPSGAYVYVNDDSNPMGKTPVSISLYIGKSSLELKKEGYENIEKDVFIEDDSLLEFDFKKINPPTTLPHTATPVPTTPKPTTTPPPTTTPKPTTTSPTTTLPPSTVPPPNSNFLIYAGVFVGIVALFLAIYTISKKKPEKDEYIGKEHKRREEEISPQMKKLLEEKAEWRKKLNNLKSQKDELIQKRFMTEEIYHQKYEEIMDKLVDIEDRIIQEKLKKGVKK